MNKIKISNKKERIKIEFDFENVQAAREYFQNEERIVDIVEALDYKEEVEETDDAPQYDKSTFETLAETLKVFMEKSPRLFFDAFNKAMEDAKEYKGKK